MAIREDMRSLADEIISSHQDRVATIAELRNTVKLNLKDVRDDLAQINADRKSASRELKAELTTSTANLKQDVANMLKGFAQNRDAITKVMKADLAKGVAECKQEVDTLLKGFAQNHSTMATQMKADLAKGVVERKQEVDTLLKGFEVNLNEVRTTLAGGRDEWQKLTGTMQAKRGAVAAVGVKSPKTAPSTHAEDTVALRKRVFEYLAGHPNGTKLAELELQFRKARIQMAKIIKGLLDENKVEKRDFFYFAV